MASASARTTRSSPRGPGALSSPPAAAAASSRSRRTRTSSAGARHGPPPPRLMAAHEARAGAPANAPARASDRVPAPLLVLAAAPSVRTGGGIARGLFDDLGPAGTVLLRTLFGAVVVVALWRPRVRGRDR